MQLKDLAKVSEVTSIIKETFNNFSNIPDGNLAKNKVIIEALAKSTKGYSNEVLIAAINQRVFTESQARQILQTTALNAEQIEATLSTSSLAASQATTTGTTIGLGTAFKGLWIQIKAATASMWAFLTTNPLGWATLAVTAIAGTALGIKKYNDSLEEAKQKIRETAEESKSAVKTIKSDFDELSSTTDNIKQRYAQLAQGVENLGKVNQSRGSLSNDEYAEFLDLSNQLAELFPQLTVNYDENGNAILGLSGNVNTIVGSLNDLVSVQQKLANQEIMKNMPDIWAGFMLDDEEFDRELKSSEKAVENHLKWAEEIKKRSTLTLTNESDNNLLVNAAKEAGIMDSRYGNDFYNEKHTASEYAANSFDSAEWDFTKLSDEQFDKLLDKLQEFGAEYEDTVQIVKGNIASANSGMASYINTWLSTEWNFNKMDSNMQNVIKSMLQSGDWVDLIPETVDASNWDEVSNWLQNEFLYEINKVQDNEEISKALSEIFTNQDLTPKEKADYIKQVQDYFGEGHAITLSLTPELEVTEDLEKQSQDAINFAKEKFDGYDPTEFFKKHSINTQEEIDAWRKIVEGAESATETEKEYLNQERTNNIPAPLSISDTVTQLNTKLKPAMDSLHSAWQDMFNDDGKFDLKSVDILSTCDAIKSKLDEMSDPEGLNLDVDYSSFENFVKVLSNTESTEQDVEKAMDSLADSITEAALSGTEDFETMKSVLENLGLENSELVAFDALISNTEALKEAGLDLANASDAQIQAFANESVSAENAAQAYNMLAFHKELCNLQEMNTAGEVANLKTLAENAGYTGEVIQYLTEMEQIYQEVASGTLTPTQIGFKLARAVALKAMIEGAASQVQYAPKVDWSGAVKDAGKAGKDSGKSYKDKLKEELSDLDSVISGITGRIDDQISSINEQKSAALESIDAQKEALEEAKDAAVEALEAERDARLEVIETQKEQLEEQIKLIDKQIKQKQDEIKSIEDAAAARAREISLQEKQYALEQKRNQRTKLVYTESSGIIYRPDEQGIRKAKEEVDEAKRQIEIANIQKEIDLLEDQKDLLNEQIDLLDEQADAVNKYYEEQISQTEKYYDNLLKNLEKQRKEVEAFYSSLTKSLEQRKDKFQELTEILEKAELSAKLKQLGIDEEALLNGSEEEFNKLKDAYMNIVFQLNEGNDEVLNKLRELSGYEGTAPTMLEESNTKLGTMNDELGTANTEVGNVNSSLDKTASTTSDVATNVSDVNTNIGETTGLVNEQKGSFDELKQTIDLIVEAINKKIQAIEAGQSTVTTAVVSEMANFQLLINKILEVKEKLDSVNDTVATMNRQPIDNLTSAFQLLYDKLLLVSNLLGVSVEGEGAVNGISGAIQALNEISLEEGIIAQFTNLKTAIDSVTAAISGGGGELSEGTSSGSTSGSKGGKQGGAGGKGSEGKGESGGGNSLTGAIEEMGNKAKEVIGEPDAEGDGTVIGEFGSMETAVNDVRDAIGTEGSAGGEGGKSGSGGKGESDDTLVGSIEYLGDKTDEEMGESDGDGILGKFNEFKGVIEEAANQVKSISEGLDEIDGKEVECSITVNVKMNGSIPAFASGTVLGNMQIESATYNAKYGKAFASGTIGLKHDEKNALRSEYGQPELTVYPNGTTELTTSPVMSDLPKGTVIYNEEETKKIMDNKSNPVGNAHADGTDDSIWTTLADGSKVRPLQPGDKMWDLYNKFDAYLKSMDGNIEKLVPNSLYEHQRQMEDMAKQINYVSSVVNNNRNVQQPIVNNINVTCPGVTSKEVAQQVGVELNNMFNGLHLEAMQQSMMR